MKPIEEHEVFAAMVGATLDVKKLRSIAVESGEGLGEYADCQEFLLDNLHWLNKEFLQRFCVTDSLLKQWNAREIIFRVCLYVRGGKLIGGHIYKYKQSKATEDAPSPGYAMSPTQQEIRITGRILAYLTQENASILGYYGINTMIKIDN